MTEERWAKFTPEQREEMRAEMRRRFGDWPRPTWCEGGVEKRGDDEAKP
jgi:hypothetical protein